MNAEFAEERRGKHRVFFNAEFAEERRGKTSASGPLCEPLLCEPLRPLRSNLTSASPCDYPLCSL